MLDIDVSRDRVYVAFAGLLFDLFPVMLAVSLDGFDTVFPWAIEPSVFLHAVVVGTSVDLDDLDVESRIMLLDSPDFLLSLVVSEELEVYRSFFTLLKLATYVLGLSVLEELLEIVCIQFTRVI